jgi:hypothetical protein
MNSEKLTISSAHGFSDTGLSDSEDDEPPSVALVPWSRGILARRSHGPATPRGPAIPHQPR